MTVTPSFPDIPASEVIHTQGPSPQTVGTRYSAIEYVEVMARLPAGPVGAQGPTGPDGEDGAAWFTGSGDPNGSTISTGPNDMYIDEDTGEVWAWDDVSKSWVKTTTSLLGPTGPEGEQGLQGYTGPTGPTGMQGGGIKVVGTFPGDGNTPPTWAGVPGEGWIDSTGDLWGWIDGYGWYNYGPIMGPTGPGGVGTEHREFLFQFIIDGMWATQTITHDLSNPRPVVRVLIDLGNNGVYTADQTVAIEYSNIYREIKLTAEASIVQYNGSRGKIVVQ